MSHPYDTTSHELIPLYVDDATLAAEQRALGVIAHQDPVTAYLAGLAERTRRTMLTDLSRIASLVLGYSTEDYMRLAPDDRRALAYQVAWHQMTVVHTNAIRARLAELDYSPATINRMLAALRGVLKKCWEADLMPGEVYYKARNVEPVRGSRPPAGRDLSIAERAAMFTVCAHDPSAAGARDAAILACADAGLRRAEIAALDLASYDRAANELKVHGKGNKVREVPIQDESMRQALDDWLTVRGSEPGALFWPINKGGKMTPRRMTHQAIYNVLLRRGQQAGIANFSPHDFRRTLAGDLLDAGADLVTVQHILGHADASTTARYDRRGKRAQRAAMGLRHTPYTGRAQQRFTVDCQD